LVAATGGEGAWYSRTKRPAFSLLTRRTVGVVFVCGVCACVAGGPLQEFLQRKAPGGAEEAPFLAVLWLHTNHVPHPSMPEWFHA
jgi:hypothetical protein